LTQKFELQQQRSKKEQKEKKRGQPQKSFVVKEKNKGTTPQWDDAFY
jgi:hypothetical protein